ncbi:diguanylate cyclase (GGDEF)-like protein [Shimia isoporae]|uniref:diguanylate cyclase n=1 Tax=Shimia isoporae TaxID=647720 RepID=A0A4R1NPI0_9RHOB|nr:GGDEF domain-containing protein [Shimia isoporae]TCL09751.1 diguanylate cyclase (GGDEF)-like protein [Shimia isoporae]
MSQLSSLLKIWFCAIFALFAPIGASANSADHFHVQSPQTGDFDPVNLDGVWAFAFDTHLEPEAAIQAFQNGELKSIDVPGNWVDKAPRSRENPFAHGKATYVAHISLPAVARNDLVLTVPVIRDAYRLIWVPLNEPENARLLTQQGTLKGDLVPAVQNLTLPLPFTGEGLLLVHVRKELMSWGGINLTPIITTARAAKSAFLIESLLTGMAIGAMLLVCVKNLLLLRAFPRDRAARLLTLLALGATLRAFAATDMIETLFGPEWHSLRMRLEIGLIPVLCSVALGLHQVLLPRRFPFPVHGPVHGLGLSLTLGILVLPTDYLYSALIVAQAYVFVSFTPAILHLTHSLRNRVEGVGGLVLAGCFCAFSAVHDVVSSQTIGYEFNIVPVAVIILVSVYGQVVSRRATAALSRARELENERAELRRQHSDALHKSRHDHLTGLLNRQSFDWQLANSFAEGVAETRPTAVVIFDIDHFKAINDTHGHPVGDLVLQSLANRLASVSLREPDRLCRYGGEEFALILPDTTQAEAVGLAEHMCNLISEAPILQDAPRLSITCSFGVCATNMTDAATPEELLAAADAALYDAKSQGRNRVNWPDKPFIQAA